MGIALDPLTTVAGLLGTLLALVSTWAIALYRGMGKRIVALEKAVETCQKERVGDAAAMGEMRGTLSSQEAQLSQMRRELSISRGAFPTVRLRGNLAGVITHVSENVRLAFGYTEEALVGLNAEVLVPEELRERHRASLARRACDPKVSTSIVQFPETKMRLASGGTVPVRVNLSERAVPGGKEFVIDVTRLD